MPPWICRAGDVVIATDLQLACGKQAVVTLGPSGSPRLAAAKGHYALRLFDQPNRWTQPFFRRVQDDGEGAAHSFAGAAAAPAIRSVAGRTLGSSDQPVPHGRNESAVFGWCARRPHAHRLSVQADRARSANSSLALRGILARRRK